MRSRVIRYMLFFTVGLVVVLLIGSLIGVSLTNSTMADLAANTKRLPLLLMPIRWAVYTLVIWQWQRIVAWLAARNPDIWTTDATTAAIALRPRIAVMAVFVELFINLPVLPTLIDWARS